MPTRRDLVILGSSSVVASVINPVRGFTRPAQSRLQTRLFNFRDDAAPDKTQKLLAALQDLSKSPGIGGVLVRRNIISVKYPTRFEWMYMVQFDSASRPPGTDGAERAFSLLQNRLAAFCRNDVACELKCPLPVRFADAVGVKVRHIVMFDFKPDATPQARERNVAAIRSMGSLPMVAHYLVEQSALEPKDPTQMEWQVTGDFASMADYQAYSQAPVHLAIRKDFIANTSRVTFLDVAV